MPAKPDRSPMLVRVCAWCGITIPGGERIPKSGTPAPLVTHSICQACRDAFIREATIHAMTSPEADPPKKEAA